MGSDLPSPLGLFIPHACLSNLVYLGFFFMFTFERETERQRERERERERENEWGGQRQRETQNPKKAPSSELSGLRPMSCEIMTQAKGGRLTD